LSKRTRSGQLPYFEQGTPKASFSLQKRDIEIIKAVYDHRFLDSGHLRALFQDTVNPPVVHGNHTGQVITKRLSKLYHHGFLDRPKEQIVFRVLGRGSRNLIYALGTRGAEALADYYGMDFGKVKWQIGGKEGESRIFDIDWEKKNSQVKSRHILHTLMISNFRITLELALKRHPEIKLLFFKPREELKTEYLRVTTPTGKLRGVRILPDGFFGLKFTPKPPPNKTYFFLEADRSTMSNATFYNKKVLGYYKYYQDKIQTQRYGIKGFRVLIITKTSQREENLRGKTKDFKPALKDRTLYWFTCEKNYNLENPETILSKIWLTPGDNEARSILP